MGCKKSKLQRKESETQAPGGHISPWELGQEVRPDNLQPTQNQVSNYRVQSDRYYNYNVTGNQHTGNSRGYQTDYSYYNNANVTGSYGSAAPSYNGVRELNRVQNFNNNAYYNGSLNDLSVLGNPVPNNYTYNQFGQELIQHTYISRSYPNLQQCHNDNRERSMGPPLRPVSRVDRFSRHHSFNDGYRRAHQDTNYNSMVRYGSLDNIPVRATNRFSRSNSTNNINLCQNSSVCNGKYPKRRNSGRQRNRKRKSLDNDSLSSSTAVSDGSGSVTNSNLDTGIIVPRVKRRPSEKISTSTDSTKESNEGGSNEEKDITCKDEDKGKDVTCKDEDKGKDVTCKDGDEGKDVNCNDTTKTSNKSVVLLSCYDEPLDILDLLIYPEEWSSGAVDKTGLVDISLLSPEGKSVQRYFHRSSQSREFSLRITGIERIENPFMHSCYQLKKQEMESRNEHVDELYLYHGTKEEHLNGILDNNLNWRLCKEKHKFGEGVSFSPFATYSSHYSDRTSVKFMLLFKVLTSHSITGSPDMKIPPIIQNVVYDTSIKDDTSVIVKYSDNEFYPLYKITYCKIFRY
ncbi:homeobox protein 2-like [Macrosteles quadrilineatus]|uniref:homeobox protein 2-like n=1 Tax=Macrosteles quadrilineatus TaxID=74068 RepID=UPI0023E20EF2|nr:homeobox protein 2-like [Macrosteles quadrilineatus]